MVAVTSQMGPKSFVTCVGIASDAAGHRILLVILCRGRAAPHLRFRRGQQSRPFRLGWVGNVGRQLGDEAVPPEDAEMLKHFVTKKDREAFELLVACHGS